MKYKQLDLFKDEVDTRLSLPQAKALSIHALQEAGSQYDHWLVGFSGGKDSSATVTLIDHLIETGQIPKPKSLLVAYNDTLMELPPLAIHADRMLNLLSNKGWRVFRTQPRLKYTTRKGALTSGRFFVQLLGVGYPPPNSGFTWCRDRMKLQPTTAIMKLIKEEYGEDILTIDGVRIGESAIRDKAIHASCKKDDGECGATVFRQVRTGTSHSPIAHWRVCHVWDWLFMADIELGYPTASVAEIYGAEISDGIEDLSARTGCYGCPVVTASGARKPSKDKALRRIILMPQWSHLEPMTELEELYWNLHFDYSNRYIWDANKKGNPGRHGRPGALTLDARKYALEKILGIEERVNRAAIALGRQTIQIIRPEELELILQLQSEGACPEGWDIDDPIGGDRLEPLIVDGQTALAL